MSTTDREQRVSLPRLVEVERLDRATFHERYEAMPEDTKAELIGGVVYMASPLGKKHGTVSRSASFCLSYYESFTPGLEVLDNASVSLDDSSELQPDTILRILPEYGGRTHDAGMYYAGGPELVVEVSDTTLRTDLGPKLADYERAGVPEYIALAISPPAVRRFLQREGRLVEVGPGDDGLYRSQVFPGLWLDPVALLAGDTRALRLAVDRGLATPEHADFVATLARAGGEGRR